MTRETQIYKIKSMSLDKETITARSAIRTGIDTLLQQKGIDPKRVTRNGGQVVVEVFPTLDDIIEPPLIGEELQNFIMVQYPNRNVAIKNIGVSYTQAVVEVDQLDSPNEKGGVVDPRQEVVRSTTLYLDISSDPMKYAITRYSFREWLNGVLGPTELDTDVFDPRIILSIASIVPYPNPKKDKSPEKVRVVDFAGTPAWKRLLGLYNTTGELIAINLPDPIEYTLQRRIIIY